MGKKITRSEEYKRRMSAALTGRKLSDETKAKLSKAAKGRVPWNKGISPSDELRERLSKANKGKPRSSEATSKGLATKKRNGTLRVPGSFTLSKESRAKISESLKGNVPWNKGKQLSDEQKEKIRAAARTPEARERSRQRQLGKKVPYKARPKKQCWVCGRHVAMSAFNRWHGNNCDPARGQHKISWTPEVKDDSKYVKWYNQIVNRAQNRQVPKETYTESHHIIPRSLGGSNLPSNLAILTGREHFICHWLLTKMYIGKAKSKMIYALSMMKASPTATHMPRYDTKITSRVYAYCAIERGKLNSKLFTGRIVSSETRKKLSLSKMGKPGHKTSEATKQKLRESSTGRKHSPESIERMKKAQKGRTFSEDTIKKMSIAAKNRAKKVCPYCQIEVDSSNYAQSHGDKCKLKILVCTDSA